MVNGCKLELALLGPSRDVHTAPEHGSVKLACVHSMCTSSSPTLHVPSIGSAAHDHNLQDDMISHLSAHHKFKIFVAHNQVSHVVMLVEKGIFLPVACVVCGICLHMATGIHHAVVYLLALVMARLASGQLQPDSI